MPKREQTHEHERKIIETRGSFPTDEAALKRLFVVIRSAGFHWRRPITVGAGAIIFVFSSAANTYRPAPATLYSGIDEGDCQNSLRPYPSG